MPAPAIAASSSGTHLLPWQERFLHVPDTFNVFLGGGRGGGKSTGAALLILRFLVLYGANAAALVIRPDTYQGSSDFEDAIEDLLKDAFPGSVHRNRQDHTIRIAGGGRVEFGALDQKTVRKYQGREFGLIVADEAGNFSTLKYLDMLRSNLRSGTGIPTRLIVVANPGGPAHTVLARRYINGRKPWHPFHDPHGETWVYVPTTFADNPNLDPVEYKRRLAASAGGDSALAEAWITGSWDAVTGAFFASLLSPRQVLTDDSWVVPADPAWETGVGLDWGQSRPTAVLLYATPRLPGLEGPEGRVFPVGSRLILDELATVSTDDLNTGLDWPPAMVAEEVLVRCARWNVKPRGVGDDYRGLADSTLLKQLREHGLVLKKPRKDRVSGWVKVKAMLAEAAKDYPEDPGIWIRERCRYLHETLPILQRNPLRPEDMDSSGPDHAADALRYLAVQEPPPPRPPVVQPRIIG